MSSSYLSKPRTFGATGTEDVGQDADPDWKSPVVPPISAQQATADLELPLLLDLGPLPDPITQVVKLGPTDVAASGDLDAIDDR